MAWQLRVAGTDQLAAIMAIESPTFGTDAWSAATMRADLGNRNCYYLVASHVESPDRIEGYAGLLAPPGSGEADIQTIAVVESARRTGLGKMLMQALIAEARARRARSVFLEVRADNPGAQRLYDLLGFEQIAVRPNYYQPDGIDAHIMKLSVKPVSTSLVEPVDTSLVEPGISTSSTNETPPVEPVETETPLVEPVETETPLVEPRISTSSINETPLVEPVETPSAIITPHEPLVLGIETSCDETGIGIVRGRTLLANVISSSMDEHARYGGVVPEVAARAHLEALEPALAAALVEAGVTLADIDAIAVTSGPGLSGALMVGVGAAKALAVALDKPIYAVNHLVGHVGADVLREDGTTIELPTIALLVSGGHTSLLLVRDLVSDVELLGETIDDAAGEAFDKVARLLGLPYPGGPQIDRAAIGGNPKAIRFPRGLSQAKDMATHRYDFSFSGLKTAVARWVEQKRDSGEPVPVADVAASFRESVADVLLSKAIAACHAHNVPRLLLGGGVVANARIRLLAAERCAAEGIELRIPPLDLCTDNGAMIAALGAALIQAGHAPSTLDFGADSTLPVTTIQA